MSTFASDKITLYTSSWCGHSMSVEGFLDRNDIPVEKINIDKDAESRERLIHLNGGYASVPTLIFPDGTKLTEPSIGQIRTKLAMEAPPGLMDRIRGLLGQEDEQNSL